MAEGAYSPVEARTAPESPEPTTGRRGGFWPPCLAWLLGVPAIVATVGALAWPR